MFWHGHLTQMVGNRNMLIGKVLNLRKIYKVNAKYFLSAAKEGEIWYGQNVLHSMKIIFG